MDENARWEPKPTGCNEIFEIGEMMHKKGRMRNIDIREELENH